MTRTGCVYTMSLQLNVVVGGYFDYFVGQNKCMLKSSQFVHDITICKVENSVRYVDNSVERVNNRLKECDFT